MNLSLKYEMNPVLKAGLTINHLVVIGASQ